MFYVCGVKNNLIGVTDTSDGITEWLSYNDFQNACKSVQIGGTVKNNNIYEPYCKTENALQEYISKVKSLLVKLEFMGMIDKRTAENKIIDLAIKYGFITNPSSIFIDINKKSMLIRTLKYIYTWDEANDFKGTNDINMCDADSAKISKLGSIIFNYLYLDVDGVKVYLNDILKEFMSFSRMYWLDSRDIYYVGITPSNKMFKFIVADDKYEVFSVQIGTKAQLIKNKEKILAQKSESFGDFKSYINNVLTKCDDKDLDFVIIKATRKSYSSLYLSSLINKLKDKYKTIHDVYIKQ